MSRLGFELKEGQAFHRERIKVDPRQDLLERQAQEERAARRRKVEIGLFLAAGGLLFGAVEYFR